MKHDAPERPPRSPISSLYRSAVSGDEHSALFIPSAREAPTSASVVPLPPRSKRVSEEDVENMTIDQLVKHVEVELGDYNPESRRWSSEKRFELVRHVNEFFQDCQEPDHDEHGLETLRLFFYRLLWSDRKEWKNVSLKLRLSIDACREEWFSILPTPAFKKSVEAELEAYSTLASDLQQLWSEDPEALEELDETARTTKDTYTESFGLLGAYHLLWDAHDLTWMELSALLNIPEDQCRSEWFCREQKKGELLRAQGHPPHPRLGKLRGSRKPQDLEGFFGRNPKTKRHPKVLALSEACPHPGYKPTTSSLKTSESRKADDPELVFGRYRHFSRRRSLDVFSNLLQRGWI